MMMGDVDAMLAMQAPKLIAGADDGIRVIALGLSGRRDEARVRLAKMRESSRIPLFVGWMDYIEAWLDGSARNVTGEIERAGLGALKIQDDPEAIFQEGWMSCDVGEHARGLADLERAVAKGYFVAPTLTRWPQFDACVASRASRRCSPPPRPAAPAPWPRSAKRAASACSAPPLPGNRARADEDASRRRRR